MKEIMNEQLNEKIKSIESKIKDAKQALKSWANQIGKYHVQLKALSQQLSQIKGEITMNNNPKGETK
jgi:chromosome segregation ATPase